MSVVEIRDRVGLTQSQFAKFVGIPLKTLQSWEQGYRKPADYIVKLIDFYIKNTIEQED